MKTPVDILIGQQAAWTENPPPKEKSDLPYATHSGVWEFEGMKLRVHRLSDGRAIIEEESMREFLNWLSGGDPEVLSTIAQFMPERKP